MEIAKDIVARLNAGSDFVVLAKMYSEGPYAERGGDMGWVKEGELMGAINDLIFSMQPGEISGTLKTNLGLHIFMVEESREPEKIGFIRAKPEIERIVINHKLEKKLSVWIERLKKNAYIAFR